MKNSRLFIGFIFATLIVFIAGCRPADTETGEGAPHVHDGENAAHVTEGEDAGHAHEELEVSPAKQKDWGIDMGAVIRQKVGSRIMLPGVLALNDNRTARVTAFVHGQAKTVAADLGQRVGKGRVLLTLNSPEFARTQAEFLEARANLKFSLLDFERAERLYGEKAIEEKEYLRREAEKEKWAMTVGALESTLHAYGLDDAGVDDLARRCDMRDAAGDLCQLADPHLAIKSPAAGIIIQRDVITGQHIVPEDILFTVSDLNVLWALLDAHEKDLPFIKLDSRVVIRSPLYPEEDFPGRITYIGDVIDEKLRTVSIRVEVGNPEGRLKPNMYIEGQLENAAADKELLSVPAAAVQTLEGEKVVFVSRGDNLYQVRHVRPGRRIGDRIIIASGLRVDERIVVKGAFNLKAEMSKATFGHAHVH